MSRKMIYLDDAIDAMACVSDSICGQQAIDALCELPSAQPYTDEEIQTMQDLEQAQFEKVYQLGYEDGKKDAEPERKWIPVTERLPEESGTYTVTAYDGATKRVTYAKYQKRLKRWELTGARAYWRVLAWMPLPDPWKGETE